MTNNMLKDQDWENIEGLFDAFQLLSSNGLMSAELWRRFHCVCCREIWEFVTDSRSQMAVEVAESVIDESASLERLRQSFEAASLVANEAWEKVQSLRVPAKLGLSVWPVSRAVDEAWIRYSAASAAKTCAEIAEDAVLFTTIPDSVCDVRAWRDARTSVVGRGCGDEIVDEQTREAVLKRWGEIRSEEEERLVGILRGLLDVEQ